MLCRVAEQVLWMGRYVERALSVGRLLEVSEHLELTDLEADGALAGASPTSHWTPLLAPRVRDEPVPAALAALADATLAGYDPAAVRRWLAFDRSNPRSIRTCVERARSAARQVRDRISSEMWEALNALHLSLADPATRDAADQDPHAFYQRVRGGAQFVQGLGDATIARDECWHFYCLGTYLERADHVAHTLVSQAHLLHDAGGAESDIVRWLSVLRSCGASEGYARFYSQRVEPARVVEFLLLNALFPQTIRFSVSRAWQSLQSLATEDVDAASRHGPTPPVRALGMLHARLAHATVDEIVEEGLVPYLDGVQRDVARVADCVAREYLRDEPGGGRVLGAARAARLMAEQQQQCAGGAR